MTKDQYKRKYWLRDWNLRKSLLENAAQMLQDLYDDFDKVGGYGPAVITEADKWMVCIKSLRAGLLGSFVNRKVIPTEEELQVFIPAENQNLERGEAMNWRMLLPEFLAWWHDIDCDRCLSDFDLTLGWFSGKGCSHEQSLEAAEHIRDTCGGTP